ncbi:TonB-dependent receptor [Bacteroides xylanisolvens]|nr:TonB-dependent receptor [Bacteroides xylanisolvens]
MTGTRDFAIGLIPDLDYGDKTNQEASGKTQETAHAGLVGRLNYDFSNRYLVEFNFRYDGTYKFRAGNRWGFFPGVSLGWRVSEEAFFKKLLPDMDNLKIRASYAKVGDEGDFDAFQVSGWIYVSRKLYHGQQRSDFGHDYGRYGKPVADLV